MAKDFIEIIKSGGSNTLSPANNAPKGTGQVSEFVKKKAAQHQQQLKQMDTQTKAENAQIIKAGSRAGNRLPNTTAQARRATISNFLNENYTPMPKRSFAELADEAEQAYQGYIASDTYKQKREAYMQEAASRGVDPYAFIGLAFNYVDQTEQELKSRASYYRTQAQQEADNAVTLRNMNEFKTWSPTDQAALMRYVAENNAEFFAGEPTFQNARFNAQELIDKYGAQKVMEMAESYRRAKNQEISETAGTMAQEAADGTAGGILHSALSVGANVANALTSPVGYLQELVNRTGQYSTLDPNNAGNLFSQYAGNVRQKVAENIAGDEYSKLGIQTKEGGLLRQAGATLYEAFMSAVDSGARLLFGKMLGSEKISLGLAATGSFGQTVSQMSTQGADPARAVWMGIIDGALEIATEKWSLDNLLKEAKAGPKNIKEILWNVLKQGGIEVTEEELSLLGSTFAEAAILQDKSGYNQQVGQLMARGKPYAQARQEANKALLMEAVETGVQSFLSGGMMAGGTDVVVNVADMFNSRGKPKQRTQQKNESMILKDGEVEGVSLPTVGVSIETTDRVKQKFIAQAGRLAKATGRDIVFYSADRTANGIENGYFADGKIYVNTRSENAVAQIVSHELTHSVEFADAYQDLSRTVFEKIRSMGADVESLRQQKMALYAENGHALKDTAAVDQEIVADFVEQYLLTDEQTILDVAAQNRSLGQRIMGWIDNLLAKLGNKDAQERTFLNNARNLWAKALEQTQNRTAQAGNTNMYQGNQTDLNMTGSQTEEVDWQDPESIRAYARNLLRSGQISDPEFEGYLDMANEAEAEYDSNESSYSFAGTNARNANFQTLGTAKELERQGVANETIRQQTGWFKGMDGKWRFEVDDSSSRINEDVSNYMTLGELLQDAEILEQYPDMKDISIVFQSLPPGVYAQYNRQFDHIDVSRELKGVPEAIRDAVLHEIQHAIQNREGFTGGATVGNWERKIKAGFDSRRGEDIRKASETERKIREVQETDPEFYRDMMELDAMMPDGPRGEVDWETLEQITEDPPEWQVFDARRDELEAIYGDMKVWDFMDLLYQREKAAKNEGRTATELYWDTAGEIEARNVAGRRNLTAEERKNTPPMLGNENTVFAEETGISFDMELSEYPYNMQTVIQDYLDAVDQDVLSFVEEVQNGTAWKSKKVTVGNVSTRMADMISQLTGVENTVGNPIVMNTGAVEHIIKRHGAKGEADHSMQNNLDIARINYVLQNFDDAELSGKNSFGYRNRDNSPSQNVIFSKKINGTYFVIEAVPDTGKTGIVSAFINKKGASQVLDDNAPSSDVRNVPAPTPNKSVAENGNSVKQFSISASDKRSIASDLRNILSRGGSAAELRQYINQLEHSGGNTERAGVRAYQQGSSAEQSGAQRIIQQARMQGIGVEEYLRQNWEQYEVDGQWNLDAKAALDQERRGRRYSVSGIGEQASEEAAEKKTAQQIRDEMPAKARNYLEGVERRLLNKLGETLGISKFQNREALQQLVRDISDEFLTEGRVTDEKMDLLFDRGYAEGIVEDATFYNEYKEVKDHLRKTGISISERDQADIADFNDFRKRAYGTLRIVNDGLPVDSAYHELHEMAPGLFPESITHPADQLRRMYEVGQSIRVAEVSLQQFDGQDAENHRKWAKNDFTGVINQTVQDLRSVKRVAEEAAEKAAEKENVPTTPEEAAEAYQQLKTARKTYEKALAKNLLSDRDEMQVGRLLKGEILPEHLDPEKDNIRTITAVYEAKKEYERLTKLIAQYKKTVRAANIQKADALLETATEWKDKKVGLAYSRETMERNIYDIVPDKAVAEQIIREIFTPVHISEAEATRFKNRYRDRVRALGLSRKVVKGNLVSEAHAVQLLGEAEDNIRVLQNSRGRMKQRDGKTIEEWQSVIDEMWRESPDLNQQKIRRSVAEFRKIYDELFQQMNEVRVRNGYEPVNYRQGYFPHFQPGDGDGIMSYFGKALGIDTQVAALPTTINGLTHNFRPGIQWFGNAQERLGFNTAYDAVEGFDKYIEGVASVIHQTDNIQMLRAMESQIRYRTTDEGIRKQVDAVRADDRLKEDEKQAKINDIFEHGKYTLSNFVTEVSEYTNLLANKKSRLDRTTEALIGRRAYTIMKAWESRVGANMIAGNVSSALTNFIPLTQAGAQLDSKSMLRGMWDTLKSYKEDDGITGLSTFLTNRRGSNPLVQTWAQDASEKLKLNLLMDIVDGFTSDSIVRGAYYQNLNRGLSEAEAMHQADLFAASVMADRSKGAMPTLFESTNPLFKMFTQFQLEVNNQFSEVFKDLPRRHKEKGLLVFAWVLFKYFIGAWLFNDLFEFLAGRRPALDPIDILMDAGANLQFEKWYDEEEKKVNFDAVQSGVGEAGKNLAGAALSELPFSSGLTFFGIETDGGRIPASSAIPDLTALWDAATREGWSAEKRWKEAKDELSKLVYIIPPFGGNQLQKLWKGIKAYNEGGSYNVDAQGNDILQYPVYKDNPAEALANAIRMMVMGKSSLDTAQDWVNNGFDSLGSKQTAVYQDMLDVGTTGKAAYSLLMAIQDAEETDTETRAQIQRDILKSADVSDEAKAIVYYGLLASETNRDIMDELADQGADAGEVGKVLMAIQDTSELQGAKGSCARRDAIADSVLTDEEKIVIYRAKISYSRDADITEFSAAGMNFDEFLKVQNRYATIDEKDIGAIMKATELSRWVDGQNYSQKQAEVIKECFKYWYQTPATADRYDILVDAGLSMNDAYKLAGEISDLEPEEGETTVSDVQKWRQCVNFSSNTDIQLAALRGLITEDGRFEKIQMAYDFGVEPEAYVLYYEVRAQYDADGNGSYTNAEVTAAVNSIKGLNTAQRAALWQIVSGNKSAKNNPYSREVGEKVLDAKAAGKEQAESGVEEESFTDAIMKQLMSRGG